MSATGWSLVQERHGSPCFSPALKVPAAARPIDGICCGHVNSMLICLSSGIRTTDQAFHQRRIRRSKALRAAFTTC